MRSFIFFLLLILGNKTNSQTIISSCPQSKKIEALIDQGITSNKEGNSKMAIMVFQEGIALSKTEGCLYNEMICNKNLMLIYAQLAEYKKSLEISNEVEKLAVQLKNYRNLVILNSTRATLYDNLGLYDEAVKSYETALKYANIIEESDDRHYQLGFIYYNLAPYYEDISLKKSEEYLKKSKDEIEQIKSINEKDTFDTQKKKMNMLAAINTNLGIFYSTNKEPEKDIHLAESYFTEALKYIGQAENDVNIDTKIDLYDALLNFYNSKENYRKAIGYGEKMLEFERSFSMPYNRRSGYMGLAKSYLGIGQNETSQKYLNLFSKLNDSLSILEKKAVEEPIKQTISKNEEDYSQKLGTTILVAGTLVVMFILGGLIIWNRKKKILHRRYEAVIDNLKMKAVNDNLETGVERETSDDEVQKTINIADETIMALLSKLSKFENSYKYTRKDINLAYLVNYLGTNSKYLNEILKQYKGKSFSQYINDLRMDYIIKLLYEDPKYRTYKISYLAEECGFSSREVFTLAFKKKTGISPSYFIENINKEDEWGTQNNEFS